MSDSDGDGSSGEMKVVELDDEDFALLTFKRAKHKRLKRTSHGCLSTSERERLQREVKVLEHMKATADLEQLQCTKPLTKWSSREVLLWLRCYNDGVFWQFAPVFAAHGVEGLDGKSLLRLANESAASEFLGSHHSMAVAMAVKQLHNRNRRFLALSPKKARRAHFFKGSRKSPRMLMTPKPESTHCLSDTEVSITAALRKKRRGKKRAETELPKASSMLSALKAAKSMTVLSSASSSTVDGGRAQMGMVLGALSENDMDSSEECPAAAATTVSEMRGRAMASVSPEITAGIGEIQRVSMPVKKKTHVKSATYGELVSTQSAIGSVKTGGSSVGSGERKLRRAATASSWRQLMAEECKRKDELDSATSRARRRFPKLDCSSGKRRMNSRRKLVHDLYEKEPRSLAKRLWKRHYAADWQRFCEAKDCGGLMALALSSSSGSSSMSESDDVEYGLDLKGASVLKSSAGGSGLGYKHCSNSIVMEGWLYKRGWFHRKFIKRFSILTKDAVLLYFKERPVDAKTQPLGCVDIGRMTQESVMDTTDASQFEADKHPFQFTVKLPKRNWRFASPVSKEFPQWMAHINILFRKYSKT